MQDSDTTTAILAFNSIVETAINICKETDTMDRTEDGAWVRLSALQNLRTASNELAAEMVAQFGLSANSWEAGVVETEKIRTAAKIDGMIELDINGLAGHVHGH